MAAAFKTKAKQWSRIWHANVGIAAAVTLGAVAVSCPFIAHKGGDIGIGKALMQIHYGEFLAKDWRWLWIDLQGLALFFLIVSGWLIHFRGNKKAAERAADDPTAPGSSVTVVWENGHPEAEATARSLAQAAEERGMRAFATDSKRYQPSRLPQERWLVCVLAGEGPVLPLQLNGEKLPRLEFAVLGANAEASARCESLGAGLVARGAKAVVAPGRNGDAAPEIIAHLARFVAKPAVPKPPPKPALAST